MSVTDMQGAVDSGVAVVPAFTMGSVQLRDVLTGCMVAAGKDDTLPTLTGVRFSWVDGGYVEAVATDRYRLALAVTDTTGQNDGAFLLSRVHGAELLKLLPKPSRHDRDGVPVTVTVVDRFVTFRIDTVEGSLTREYRLLDGEFPKYHSLIPGDDKLTGCMPEGFACNPGYLADVAKLPHEKDTPVRWRFQPTHTPAVATYPTFHGVDWTYLLMPMRETR